MPEGLNEALSFASQCQIEIEFWPQARRRLCANTALTEAPPAALLARLKILGGLDIAERRLAQDGKFTLTLEEKHAAFRLSTMPVQHGEKAVIRLLQSESSTLSLGLPAAQRRLLVTALAQPQGLILVTGLTGSGKTFTLYSCLSALSRPEMNVSSVEVRWKFYWPASTRRRSIRNADSTSTGCCAPCCARIQTSLWWEKSAMRKRRRLRSKRRRQATWSYRRCNTNSTAETLTRLRQMGIPGYLLSTALRLIVAQQLMRRLCLHCRQPAQAVAHFLPDIWPGTLQT